jgi:hypothetical protein
MNVKVGLLNSSIKTIHSTGLLLKLLMRESSYKLLTTIYCIILKFN